jgi:hypothetical protein
MRIYVSKTRMSRLVNPVRYSAQRDICPYTNQNYSLSGNVTLADAKKAHGIPMRSQSTPAGPRPLRSSMGVFLQHVVYIPVAIA